jgi:RNA-directed DNA polymerase
MTAATAAQATPAAGAASRETVDWQAIDWHQAHKIVRRLQARIVKATQAGKWGKVKALQHLLTHSFSGKALAVRRVTENHGKRTPGVDGATWDTPAKKAAAIQTLRRRGYRPRPLRRVYIPKSNGKMRPLGIATMRDRAMQALYLLALDPIAETTGDPNSYGFRKGRSPADAIEQCFTVLARTGAASWILEGDIESCFDRIGHDWLLANIPLDKAILRQWLKAGVVDKHLLAATEEGTPQGGPISPVLANLTLDGLERELRRHYPANSAKNRRAKVHLIRFADDFIVTGSTKELLDEEVRPLIDAFMRARGLALSTEKTGITRIEDGFDFLGQNVRKYNGKLYIKPSRKSVKALLRKIRATIREHRQAAAGPLILRLNPVIRGWTAYHRHVCSKKCFDTLDHAIFEALWRWAKRRHPNKPKRWVKARYWHTVQGRQWVFSGGITGRDGQRRTVRLFSAAAVPIRRHVKIKGAANPYDPAWEQYFEERLGVKMARDLKGRRTLLYLWKRQDGICPQCGQKITRITGWHSHHRVWRSKGGSDRADNRELLHPECHRQLHSRGSTAPLPRPT